MFAESFRTTISVSAAFLVLGLGAASAQLRRFPEIERRYDAVVLVADVRTGRIVAGAHIAEANERRYHPGSLFKLAIAAAALRSGKFDRSFRYVCHGKDTIAGAERRCWRADGHDTIGVREAIALSCNLYFRHIARILSPREIAQGARAIGMLDPATDDQARINGLTDLTLLGSAFPVSPARMLDVAVTLASRGRSGSGGVDLRGAMYAPLYDGMERCISSGTGHDAWTARFSMAGKTGTSEIEGTRRTVGWFLGFTPVDEPRYAVVVMQPNARGAEAAAIARKALEILM